MLFNSYAFILLFLPITLVLYDLIGRSGKPVLSKLWLLAASYAFIAYANIRYALILLLSTAVNYACSRAMKSRRSAAKPLLIAGVVFNVALLGFFKYANFLIDNINLAFGSDLSALSVILPIGISFYSFQQIAYLVDTYRDEVPDHGVLDYFLFTAFFPKVIQGPITRHDELIPQFNAPGKKTLHFDNLSGGLLLFAIGLSKKVLLADTFGKIVDYGFGHVSSLNSFEAVLVIFGYALQIYFDFSGYCDMAMGVSRMLNIDLPLNFNSPYKALDINDFWKRWHITLTRFLTKYIYIPLGGNRKGKARTYANIMAVFLVSGLWHGAGYTFLVWGALHGLASILYRLTKKSYDSLPRFVRWAMSFVFVSIAWVFFRADSLSAAINLLARVFDGGFGINAELTETLLQPAVISLLSQAIPFVGVILLLFLSAVVFVGLPKNSNEMLVAFRPNIRSWLFTLVLLVLSILSISGVSTFLYSNF